MARKACPCEGRERAIQAVIRLIRLADARRLDGPVEQGHDNIGYAV
jgi:hypothetical protein